MAGRRKPKANAKGRNATRFGRENAVLILRRRLWHSPLISAASPTARALLVEMLAMYTGKRRIFLSVKDATERLGFSDSRPAMEAFSELQALRLVTCVSKGAFTVKSGFLRASVWQLNWVTDDGERIDPDHLPSVNECPIDKRARKRLERRQTALKRYFNENPDFDEDRSTVVESTTLNPVSGENDPAKIVENTTLADQNGGKPSLRIVGDSTVHLSYQRGAGERAEIDLQPLLEHVGQIAGLFDPDHRNRIALREVEELLGSLIAARKAA